MKTRDDKDRLSIAGTGHRPQKLNPFDQNDRKFGYSQEANQILLETARQSLSDIQELHPEREIEIISGVALGFDQALIEAALEKNIHVVAAIPFEGQEKAWRMDTQRQYHELLDRVKAAGGEIHVVSPGGYSAAKMQARNVWMVDRADQIIALYNGGTGGTANCIDYAKDQGKAIHNVWQSFTDRVRQSREKGVEQNQQNQQHSQSSLHAQIDVVHVNTYRGERGENFIYIGRAMPAHNLEASPLANPYRIGPDGTREEVIEKSYIWLRNEFKDLNSPARNELLRIKGMVEAGQKVTLACWCAPQKCHGEVIRDSVVKLIERDRTRGAQESRIEETVREPREAQASTRQTESRAETASRTNGSPAQHEGGGPQREIQTERTESTRAQQAHLDILGRERVYYAEELHILNDSSGTTLTKQDGELRTETDYKVIPEGFSRDDYHSLYNPGEGRTRAGHAGYLNGVDQEARDAFERGATLYGDVLIIPREFDTLPREANITTRQHAVRVIGEFIKDDVLAQEKADELVTTAEQICGRFMDSLPSGTKAKITIYQNLYEQITEDEHGRPLPMEERAEALERTLESSRVLAQEMMALEPRLEDEEHIVDAPEEEHELAQLVPELVHDENELYAHIYEEAVEMGQLASDSHDHVEVEDRTGPALTETSYERISLSDLPPAIPEGISLEDRERLLTETLPSVDRAIESGIRRDDIVHGHNITKAIADKDAHDVEIYKLYIASDPSNADRSGVPTREEQISARITLLVLVTEELYKERSRFRPEVLQQARALHHSAPREAEAVRRMNVEEMHGAVGPSHCPPASDYYTQRERDISVGQQQLLRLDRVPNASTIERLERLEQAQRNIVGSMGWLQASKDQLVAAVDEVGARAQFVINTELSKLASYEQSEQKRAQLDASLRGNQLSQTERLSANSERRHAEIEIENIRRDYLNRMGLMPDSPAQAREAISPHIAGVERSSRVVTQARSLLIGNEAAHATEKTTVEKVGPVFVSMAGRPNVRLPLNNFREYAAFTTIADACHLPVNSWQGINGRLIDGRSESRTQVSHFINDYINYRLKDGETRLQNESVEYRVYQERLNGAQTLEELRSTAKEIRRDNYSRSQQIRAHGQDPTNHALPPRLDPTQSTRPRALTSDQMRQLFISQPPAHYTEEMKDYRRGLSVMGREKAERVEALSRGDLKPSRDLSALLGELERRSTPEALNHYTRCLMKPASEMVRPSSFDMNAVYEKMLPYERDYLYKTLSDKRGALVAQHTRGQTQGEVIQRPADERTMERSAIRELSASSVFKNYYAAATWKEAELFTLEQVRRGPNATQSERRCTVVHGISDRNLSAIGYVLHNTDPRQARDVAAYLMSSQSRQMKAAGEVLHAFSEIKRDAKDDGRVELSLTIPQQSRFGESDWRTLFNHFHPGDRSESRFSREVLPEGRQADIRRDAQSMAWSEMEPQLRATSYSPDSRAEVLYKALDARETLQATRELQESARTAHYTLEGHVQSCTAEVERRRSPQRAANGQTEVERGAYDRDRTESLVMAALDPEYARDNSGLVNEHAEEYQIVQQAVTTAHVKTYRQLKEYAAKAKQKYLHSFLGLDRKQQELSTAKDFDSQQRPQPSSSQEEQLRASEARAAYQRSFEESERQLTGERLERMLEEGQLSDRSRVSPDQPIRNLLQPEERQLIADEARESAWWSLVPEEARAASYDERTSVEVLDRALEVSDAVSNARDVDKELAAARAELTEFLSNHAPSEGQARDSGETLAREQSAFDSSERDLERAGEILQSLDGEDRERLEGLMERVGTGGQEMGRAFEEIDRAQAGLNVAREEQLMEHRAALFSEVRRPMEERMIGYLNEAYRLDGIEAFRDTDLAEQHVLALSETMRDCVEDYNITLEDLNLRSEDLQDIARDLVSSVSATLEHNQEHTINRDIFTSGHDYANVQRPDLRALDLTGLRPGDARDQTLNELTLQELSEHAKSETTPDFTRDDLMNPRGVDKEQTEGVRGMESPVVEQDRVSDHLEHIHEDIQIFTH